MPSDGQSSMGTMWDSVPPGTPRDQKDEIRERGGLIKETDRTLNTLELLSEENLDQLWIQLGCSLDSFNSGAAE
eukprot:660414-Rhodomonas_salina.1